MIAEDRGVIFEDAYDLMLETGDYGQGVFAEEDDDRELDEILEQNVCIARVTRGKMKVYDDIDAKDPVCSDLAHHQYSLC